MSTPDPKNELLSEGVMHRSLMITVGVRLSGFPQDTLTALAMVRSGLVGLRIFGRPMSELRGHVNELISELEKAPFGALSIDQALADAKAHAAKPAVGGATVAQNFDANGGPIP